MERIPEPELMDEDEQARAYAYADFEVPHSNVIRLFQEKFAARKITGTVLDLGCGPGDISMRFARAYPHCMIHGIDGAEAMLHYGRELLSQSPELQGRVEFIHVLLPTTDLPRKQYDVVISNSLLHHLHDPQVLWQAVRQYAAPDAPIFIMDLRRPGSREEAQDLTETYVANESEVLRHDFYNSLLAAFTPEEVEVQLRETGLEHLSVEVASDRHMIIWG